MTAEQPLLQEMQESQTSLAGEKDECIYKRDLRKRIELISWTLEHMKIAGVDICALIETKMNQIIDELNKKDSIIEADPLDSQLRILDYILYVVCTDQLK